MNSFDTLYAQHAGVLWLVFFIVLCLTILWLSAMQARTRRVERRLNDIFRGASSENTARMLADYFSTVRTTADTVDRLRQEQDRMATIMPNVIQHVGLVRFSPFHDTGGDQSFTLAFLDGQGDGVVLTALHSRTDSRLYAKPIRAGSSNYPLTGEEKEAMERARQRMVEQTTA